MATSYKTDLVSELFPCKAFCTNARTEAWLKLFNQSYPTAGSVEFIIRLVDVQAPEAGVYGADSDWDKWRRGVGLGLELSGAVNRLPEMILIL